MLDNIGLKMDGMQATVFPDWGRFGARPAGSPGQASIT